MERSTLGEAADRVAEFMAEQSLTARLASLESELDGLAADDVATLTEQAGINEELLGAALEVRTAFGRVSDLVHASAIALVLPLILEPDERLVKRPSLAAGNDPDRPYDLETDRRVAEFKLARWQGNDAMRRRQTFKDLVHLAADESGRRAELYVVGERPISFLHTTSAKAAWGLTRGSQATTDLFVRRFGSTEVPISEFMSSQAGHVTLVDLESVAPDLFARASGHPSLAEDEAE